MIDGESQLSVRRQCELLRVSRSGLYYEPAETGPEELALMRRMPEMDGHDLLQCVRRLAPSDGGQTPAIALTAYASGEDVERCVASGFQSHIAKPVDPEHLVRLVGNLARPTEKR